jgi:hypothetical protein
MIGGVFGILFSIYLFIFTPYSFSFLVIILLFILVSIASLSAGIFLWKKTKFGKILSIIIQLIQLPKIFSPTLTFFFSFGLDLYPYYWIKDSFTKIGIDFRVLGSLQIFLNNEQMPTGIGISLISIIFILILSYFYPPEIPAGPEGTTSLPVPEEHFGVDKKTEDN